MKVISLNPPYGTLIAASERFPELGKHIETRGRWDYEHRGELLVHQTKGLGEMFDSEEELQAFCEQEPFRTTLAAMGYRDASELPRGAIVALCRLKDCRVIGRELSGVATYLADDLLSFEPVGWREKAFGNYAPGRRAILLAGIRQIDPPIPARGMPGLWDYEGELPL